MGSDAVTLRKGEPRADTCKFRDQWAGICGGSDAGATSNRHSATLTSGGGLGIDYSGCGRRFDVAAFCRELTDLLDHFELGDREIILEPGTFLVGEAGYYVAEIVDIKESKGQKHIVAAGGVNHLRLPSASGINQPVVVLRRGLPRIHPAQPRVQDEQVDIGGPLCFHEDRLAVSARVDSAEVGDLVVICMAGAYGYSVSSLELLSHPHPPEYLL